MKKESFRGLPNLVGLYLDDNEVPLSAYLFGELTHLERLTLRGNKINSIPANSFAGLSNLTYFDLSKNDIAVIDADITSSLNTQLQHLSLRDNKITRISSDTFADLTGLIYLDLSDNPLEDLTDDVFRGLNSLEELFLDNNEITSISEELFHNLVGLKSLSHLIKMRSALSSPGRFKVCLGWKNCP